ncbi:plasmid partitioning protein RepA [Paracoccus aminophilus]|uniref:Replication protein A n=1 Tax=Paracoccus aminophilus JCM 7686 TaxID=1367847 RepID=S5XVG6_PARAH|nr:plasmid partitioning protein RepA [Paracoccus aminophilus]AGT11504.1 replication protein A [Paracoccus aminophilus JCM 7686]
MRESVRIDQAIRENADILDAALESHLRKTFLPDSRKTLRTFSSAEAAELLGLSQSHLRKLHFDGKLPAIEADGRARRQYRAEDLLEMRDALAAAAKSGTSARFLPGRRPGDKLQVIAIANYKGGSSKTTASIHLAQRLALRGYRVLAIDIDPQASLTSMFGYRAEIEFASGGTIYDAIRYADPVPLRNVIIKTYFPNLDLAPAGLRLADFEHETPIAIRQQVDPPFYLRLPMALQQVDADYDVVIIDCPPQLGFLTLSAMVSATTMLITVIPSMLDVASMSQFLQMASGLLAVVAKYDVDMSYDFLRFMITRYEPSDGPQTQMAALLRSLFGKQVMVETFLKSTAISDAGLTQQTLYEVDRAQFHRNTYDRAVESINGVANELETMIQSAWGRT